MLKQTIKNIEVIVINDCSKDNTYEQLKKYKDKIVLINNKKNIGPAASRNKGLRVAKGKYIGFVDSDDYVDLNMYKTMVSYMDDEVDLVACSRINVTKKGEKPIINKSKSTNPKEFSQTSNFNCDKLFKKSIIDKYKIRFPEEYSYAEDFAFLIRYKYRANKMVILQDTFYYYLSDSQNSITNSYKRNLLQIIDVLEDTVDFFKEENKFEEYSDELLKVSMGYYTRRIKEFKKYDDVKLQKEFVKNFLNYFDNNYKHYKKKLTHYNTKKICLYRSNYLLMLIYIKRQQKRRK